MYKTRKNHRGGSRFRLFSETKVPQTTSLSMLKAKRNYNIAHSKSRVGNYLSRPGQVNYKEKAAIQANYQEAIAKLQSIEKPKESVGALRLLSDSLQAGLGSARAKETGAVVITIPVGIAQLAIKVIRILLSVLVVIFIDLPLGVMAGSPAIDVAVAVAPNSTFNTTQSIYQKAREFTGADKSVKNYR